jgi:uncharacterized RDD family membrane protein YckC
MEFTQEAKDRIEKNLHDIMANMTLTGRERADIEKELRSNFYESAEARAKERGSSTITVDDVIKVFSDEGTPKEIAADYMKTYSDKLRRAGFWYRAAAYIIDSIAMAVLGLIIALPIIFIAVLAFLTSAVKSTAANPMPFSAYSFVGIVLILVGIVTVLAEIIMYLCYYVLFEGRFGWTPGKYVMGLKVLKTDGERISYKDAILRNIPKYVSNFIIIDVLIMLIFFYKEKQRGFDRIADTMVVHTRD